MKGFTILEVMHITQCLLCQNFIDSLMLINTVVSIFLYIFDNFVIRAATNEYFDRQLICQLFFS